MPKRERYRIDWDAEEIEDTETGEQVSIQQACRLLNEMAAKLAKAESGSASKTKPGN